MLLKKGAEACLYREQWNGLDAIRKHRVRKSYRIPQLDLDIRRSRTIHETRLIHEACRAGVPTPSIYFTSLSESTIIMEFIEGSKLKDVIGSLGEQELAKVFQDIGQQVALLHKNGIIHGDLTTSNMILTASGKTFIIDFGLGEFSSSTEERGVDLHLMHRALVSAHYKRSSELYESFVRGYIGVIGENVGKEILRKVLDIESRGRYFKRKDNQTQKDRRGSVE